MRTGIRRIQQALEAAGQPPAEFDYDDYNFPVTLLSNRRAERGVPLNEKIFELVTETPGIQRKNLAEKLNLTEKTIGRAISKLTDAKKIERRGSKKTGGYWIVGQF